MRVCGRLSPGMLIGVPDPVRFLRCRAFVKSAPVIELARERVWLHHPQVHEMQSGLASFAFAIVQPAGYQGDAFQASSPKTFQGRFWRPLFLPERSRHSVLVLRYRRLAYSDRLSSSMLIGVGVIQSAPRIGYGP